MKITRPSMCVFVGSLLLAGACGKSDGKTAPAEKAEAKTELLAIGATAPDFSVQDHNGNTVSLSALQGKPVVLYWYPKDETPG